jgi:hypothetical protein
MTTLGDVIYRGAGGTTRLPIGSTNQLLTVVGGIPTWVTTLPASAEPAHTGDVTNTAGSLVMTLKNTGTPGTYTSVTTDAQGRVTGGSNWSQVSAQIGQTGDTSHAFSLSGGQGIARVGGALIVSSITGGTLQLRVSYTDLNGTARTSLIGAALSTAGPSSISPIDIIIQPGSTITIEAINTASSISYAVSFNCQQLG